MNWEPIFEYKTLSANVDPERPWLKYWPTNIPKNITFDPICIHDYVRLVAQKIPNNVAFYYIPENKKYTYREIFWYADKVANALYELGVRKGESVGIMTGNRPEFVFSSFGITQCGASISPINPLLKDSDIEYILREAGNINTIFVHKSNYRVIKKAKQSIEFDNIILLGTDQPKDDAITFEQLIQDKDPVSPQVNIDPLTDLAALLFTGGTTGLPKGVMLTHNNLVADALCSINMEKERYEKEFGRAVALGILPLCHTFGFETLIIALAAGSMLLLYNSFDPAQILADIEQYRIRLFAGIPLIFNLLIQHPDFKKRDLSSLQASVSGSAPLPPEWARKWEQGTGGSKIGMGYGLTETSPITHIQPLWLPEKKLESIGIPIIDTDAKIVDPITLNELEPGQVGELLIKGPQVMKGYWKKPEATARVILEGGWLRTGDLARMDDLGYFYIEGRTKDMIKYKGYKVMPQEIEEKLCEHPAILEVGVVGIPDPNIGETIKAFIVLKKEYHGKVKEEEIIQWAKDKLAGYKYPRKVEFLNSLPRTPVGKIFRRKLREKEE